MRCEARGMTWSGADSAEKRTCSRFAFGSEIRQNSASTNASHICVSVAETRLHWSVINQWTRRAVAGSQQRKPLR